MIASSSSEDSRSTVARYLKYSSIVSILIVIAKLFLINFEGTLKLGQVLLSVSEGDFSPVDIGLQLDYNILYGLRHCLEDGLSQAK